MKKGKYRNMKLKKLMLFCKHIVKDKCRLHLSISKCQRQLPFEKACVLTWQLKHYHSLLWLVQYRKVKCIPIYSTHINAQSNICKHFSVDKWREHSLFDKCRRRLSFKECFHNTNMCMLNFTYCCLTTFSYQFSTTDKDGLVLKRIHNTVETFFER